MTPFSLRSLPSSNVNRATSTSPDMPQVPLADVEAQIKDLTRHFPLNIRDDKGKPIAHFVVPPRQRTHATSLSDQDIMRMLSGIRTKPDQWLFSNVTSEQGDKAVTCTHVSRLTGKIAPILTLTIGPDNFLSHFAVDVGGTVSTAHFEARLPPPQNLRRHPPGRLEQVSSDRRLAQMDEGRATSPSRFEESVLPSSTRTPPTTQVTHENLHRSPRYRSPSAPAGLSQNQYNKALLNVQAPLAPQDNGLYVEDQLKTIITYNIGNTWPSHAINHAFQGNAMGLALQSVHVGDMEAVLLSVRDVEMESFSIIFDSISEASEDEEFKTVVDRLEQSGTVIVERGGQDHTRDVPQHFVTLVSHASDECIYLLDSLRPDNNIHYATAEEALLAQINELANGNRYLTVLVPKEGQVLPPAPTNPHGAYLHGWGFVPLADLNESDLDVVEHSHGWEVRASLEQARAQQLQALPPEAASWGASRNNPLSSAPDQAMDNSAASREKNASTVFAMRQESVDRLVEETYAKAKRHKKRLISEKSLQDLKAGLDELNAKKGKNTIGIAEAAAYYQSKVPYIRAKYSSGVPGIYWHTHRNGWQVGGIGPKGKKLPFHFVPLAAHGGSLEKSLESAKARLRQMQDDQDGTHVPVRKGAKVD